MLIPTPETLRPELWLRAWDLKVENSGLIGSRARGFKGSPDLKLK